MSLADDAVEARAGHELLAAARPTHDAALGQALDKAVELPELAPLVHALSSLTSGQKV